MADDLEEFTTIFELGMIALAAYIVYEIYSGSTNFINSLFGVTQGAGTYSGAAGTVAAHPLGSLESILGVGTGYSSSQSGQMVGDATWYSLTAGGQDYRCNASTPDLCYPIATDANGNQTVTGVPVPAANLQSTVAGGGSAF